MATKSRRILVQMGGVLVVALMAAIVTFIWQLDTVAGVLLGDPRPLILNGVIVLLFALGIWQLYRGIRHYERQELQIDEFVSRRAAGRSCVDSLPTEGEPSLLGDRYDTIKQLFDRGGPVDHGAIAAIMVAEESQHQSFPRFVNNVLILTGVFGTVSSLIFALVGASDVLQAAAPDAGMGLLLLGMNTALTTTATAIVCYFFFTFFYHRFNDLQTWILGRVERAVLLHMVPEFSFEADTVNHQAKILLEDVRELVAGLGAGLGGIETVLARQDIADQERRQQLETVVARLETQNQQTEQAQARLAELHRALVEGFRLER